MPCPARELLLTHTPALNLSLSTESSVPLLFRFLLLDQDIRSGESWNHSRATEIVQWEAERLRGIASAPRTKRTAAIHPPKPTALPRKCFALVVGEQMGFFFLPKRLSQPCLPADPELVLRSTSSGYKGPEEFWCPTECNPLATADDEPRIVARPASGCGIRNFKRDKL